jgi:two-component system chemotaxis response regulator CheB
MDIHMPRMDGFEATKEIMIESPTPIVIITSSRSVLEVELSMHALRAGALAILEKPAGPAHPGFDEAAKQLIAQVKAMSQVKVVRHWRTNNRITTAEPTSAQRQGRPHVIAVAASTGGPAALHTLLSGLPGDFPVPLLVVQHISHGFIHGLADWLNKTGRLHVRVAEDGESLKKGTAYLAPDAHHLGVSAVGQVALSATPALGGFRPSGTFLFESVARVYGSSATALILTGMGEDGVTGLQVVRHEGGRVLAQDEKSSIVFGMPNAAILANVVDEILPIEEMATRLVELVA